MKSRYRRILGVVAALSVVALAGCTSVAGGNSSPPVSSGSTGSGISATPGNGGPSSTADATNVTCAPGSAGTIPASPESVSLGISTKSFNYLLWYLGVQKGFFSDQGINLKIEVVTSSAQIAGLLSGSLDYNGAVSTNVTATVAQNTPVKLVAVTTLKPTFHVMAKSGINSLTDLRGKVVAGSSAASDITLTTQKAIAAAGLDPRKDVQFVATGSVANAYNALIAGQADAAALTLPSFLQAQDKGFHSILAASDVSTVPEAGLATSTSQLQKDPGQVKRMLCAMLTTMQYMRANRADTAAYAATEFGLDNDVASQALDTLISDMSPDGAAPDSVIQSMIDTAAQQNGNGASDPVSTVADFSLLSAVRAG